MLAPLAKVVSSRTRNSCCFASALHLLRLQNMSAQPSMWYCYCPWLTIHWDGPVAPPTLLICCPSIHVADAGTPPIQGEGPAPPPSHWPWELAAACLWSAIPWAGLRNPPSPPTWYLSVSLFLVWIFVMCALMNLSFHIFCHIRHTWTLSHLLYCPLHSMLFFPPFCSLVLRKHLAVSLHVNRSCYVWLVTPWSSLFSTRVTSLKSGEPLHPRLVALLLVSK